MRLFIIRHGDPDYENDTLTPKGMAEAQALADWLEGVEIDEIYTSPMGRAMKTAEPTASRRGMKAEILPFAAEDIDYMAPFTSDTKCDYVFSREQGIRNYFDSSDKLEKRLERAKMLQSESDKFFARHGYFREGVFYRFDKPSDARIAVFCHAGFGTAWMGYLLGSPTLMTFRFTDMDTTGVTVIDFPNEPDGYALPRIVRFSETAHLYAAGLRNKP